MNLMKWIRKNNQKILAIVVIIIMLGFVAGPALRYLGRMGTGQHKTVAYFDDNRKITNYDLAVLARQELEILKSLRTDVLLRSQDLRGVLLGELLFSEQSVSPTLINRIKQAIRANEYRISDSQLRDIYTRSLPSEIFWLLLKNEAKRAGIVVSSNDAGRVLARAIPQLFNGLTYSQVVGSLVNPPPAVNRTGIPETKVLEVFGDLLAILMYAQIVCSTENVTSLQAMHLASWENETIDVEAVKFDSAVFAETEDSAPDEAPDEPNEEKISEHFEKYKNVFAGDVSKENPYGFGYKLDDRVQLEYIAVKLDDVSAQVSPPTDQQMEEYYQRNIKQFTTSVRSDPNDPNSPMVEKTKRYAEVAASISEKLRKDKINSRAESILQQAKALTEVNFADKTDLDLQKLTVEQLRQLAGDYKTAAEQLTKEHNIKVYAGQTGLLSAADMRTDEYFGTLYLQSHTYNPVALTQVVFAIDELKASELGPFQMARPRMYENIGPVKDMLERIMVLVRVLNAQKASAPQSIDQTFSTKTMNLQQNQEQTTEDNYSVRKKVVEDLKKLAAMDTTKSKAQEFIDLATKVGWQSALDKFNELYAPQAKKDTNDPNIFSLQKLTDLRRISTARLDTMAVQNQGNPTARLLVNEARINKQFIDQLYSLVPPDSNTVDNLPVVIEFKPALSYYCIKDISVKRLNRDEFEQIKTMQFQRQDYIQSQSLAAVHFNPENIKKRMNFRPANQGKKQTDANTPPETSAPAPGKPQETS